MDRFLQFIFVLQIFFTHVPDATGRPVAPGHSPIDAATSPAESAVMFEVLPPPENPFTPATAVAVMLAALAIDAYIGDLGLLRRGPSPRRLAMALVLWAEPRLNRVSRSRATRLVRGAVLVLFLALAAVTAGLLLQWLARDVAYGWGLEILVLVSLIAQRAPLGQVMRLRRLLRTEPLESARAMLRRDLRADTGGLDTHGVARVAIQEAARQFSDRVVAPLFWYALGGLPLLLLCAAVSAAAEVIGHRSPAYTGFGQSAARLDDVLTAVPARLAGMLVALAAPCVPKCSLRRAIAVMSRDAGKHPAPRAGWPQAAIAGALDLALGGPRWVAGAVYKDPWIGTGRARATPSDMRLAVFLLAVACLLNAALICGLLILRYQVAMWQVGA